ncbi:MAG TPA: MBL fold metallo-hydrolase, partial [Acidimicrobiia bacterium]
MKVRDLPPLLSFLGATGTVTGSRFLIETAHARVLVDAGLFQGLKDLRLRNRETFPVDPASIDAVVVTHAHLDHLGYAPALVANGFRGPIYLTTRTAQLGEIVLDDSARLQEEEADYANRHGFSKHHPALPLYTQADAAETIEQFRPVPFDSPIEVAPGVHAQFQRAGHILGSAGVLLEADGAAVRRVFVSGDVGRPGHPVLRPPVAPPAVDALLVESTYGDRRHEDPDIALDRLAQTITRTAERGGMIVIPAFAVDRTEIILLALNELVRSSRIPALPIYADSPMALAVL